MSYITPIKDRTLTDVVTKTSKGLFNVADWVRIYNNARLMVDITNIIQSLSLGWTVIAEPTVLSIPLLADFNSLLSSVEGARVALNIPAAQTAIKYDWVAGINKDAPDYTDVNLWETVIDALWDYQSGDSIEVCPTLVADLTVLTGNNKIYIDCLDTADFNIDLQGTAKLYII